MKLIARAVTALALLAFATPALPCGEKTKTTTASTAKPSEEGTKVAKSGASGKQKKAEAKGEARPATASN